MMKMWSLCFFVLAISSISRGENDTAVSSHNEDAKDSPDLLTTTPPPSSDETPTSLTATDLRPTDFTTQEETPITDEDTATTTEGDDSVAQQTTASVSVPRSGTEGVNVDVVTVSMATTSTSPKPVIIEDKGSSWGYMILIFIILMIIALCVLLYFLRRVSRTYSFDLHRPGPVNNHNEPIGTFEPVYLDDLDRPALKDQVTTEDLSPPPVANGTTLQSEEKGTSGENAPQEQSDANGLESSPTSNTSLSLGDDPADKTSSPLSSTDLFFDAIEKEQQNENNNNPSVCSSDPFVEINLDEPAWCDQLLASPEAPSSVLPFSPFSFSSTSSC